MCGYVLIDFRKEMFETVIQWHNESFQYFLA